MAYAGSKPGLWQLRFSCVFFGIFMILNLTQHPATQEQLAAGVVDLPPEQRQQLVKLLTVDTLPSRAEIVARCEAIALMALRLCSDEDCEALPGASAMIGGAPWMMSALELELDAIGIKPVYSFSVRQSTEAVVDGKVVKTAVFEHVGFVG